MAFHWILNPDAELELARPEGYAPRADVRAGMERNAATFSWLTRDDAWSWASDAHATQPARPGPRGGPAQRALLWCPTPSALRAARRLQLEIPTCPSLSVLQAANEKSNLVALPLPGPRLRRFIRTFEDFQGILAELPGNTRLRLKRRFGFAGRAQRRIGTQLSRDDARFVEDALRLGGLLLESEQEVRREWSMHGLVLPASSAAQAPPDDNVPSEHPEIWVGTACALEVDPFGSVRGIKPHASAPRELIDWVQIAGQGLGRLGFFGAFGVDFLEGDHGLVASDLNARFTLGWSLGMGALREAALDRLFR